MNGYYTLVGAVVGAVLASVLSWIGDRSRWRRTHSFRWDEARLTAYTDFSNAIKRVVHIATGMARTRGLPHSSPAVELDSGLVELAAASGHRTAVREAILLLGDPETVSAARAWNQSVWQLEFFAHGVIGGEAAWERALDEFEQARADFYRAARRDLGVGGSVITSSWPPPWLVRLDPEQQRAVSTYRARERKSIGD